MSSLSCEGFGASLSAGPLLHVCLKSKDSCSTISDLPVCKPGLSAVQFLDQEQRAVESLLRDGSCGSPNRPLVQSKAADSASSSFGWAGGLMHHIANLHGQVVAGSDGGLRIEGADGSCWRRRDLTGLFMALANLRVCRCYACPLPLCLCLRLDSACVDAPSLSIVRLKDLPCN